MIGAALFSLSMLAPSLSRSDVQRQQPEPKRYLVRVESEYSLGLSRSSSLANDLAELGPLCQTGQAFIAAIKLSMVTAAVLAALWSRRSES